MGIAELITFIPVILIISGIIYGIIWARKKSKNSTFNISMIWYYFYTYVLLPLMALGLLGQLGNFGSTNIPIESKNSYILFGFVIFLLVVIIGLAKFKIWGWSINIFLIIIVCFVYSFNSATNSLYQGIASLIIIALLWFLPNFIYFKKRIKLFS